MNKEQYLRLLESELQGIDRNERQEILAEYREHFEIALSEGRDEASVALALGNPKTLAKEIKAQTLIVQATEEVNWKKLFHAIFTATSLGFFNLVIVIGPLFGVLGILGGLYAAAAAFLCSPLISLYMNGFPSTTSDWLQFSLALLLMVAAYFLLRGLNVISKWLYKWFVKYLAYNVKLVKGKTTYES
jgi:uncharacterized membrane protein